MQNITLHFVDGIFRWNHKFVVRISSSPSPTPPIPQAQFGVGVPPTAANGSICQMVESGKGKSFGLAIIESIVYGVPQVFSQFIGQTLIGIQTQDPMVCCLIFRPIFLLNMSFKVVLDHTRSFICGDFTSIVATKAINNKNFINQINHRFDATSDVGSFVVRDDDR